MYMLMISSVMLHKILKCEQIFFNQPLIIGNDTKHSQSEVRYFTLGQTDNGRTLFVVSTIRDNIIRVISARDINKKEREVYRYEKENS